jgi:hypothetical protein
MKGGLCFASALGLLMGNGRVPCQLRKIDANRVTRLESATPSQFCHSKTSEAVKFPSFPRTSSGVIWLNTQIFIVLVAFQSPDVRLRSPQSNGVPRDRKSLRFSERSAYPDGMGTSTLRDFGNGTSKID